MLFKYNCLILINLLIFIFITSQLAASQNDFTSGYTNLALSPDETLLLFNIEAAPGLYIKNLATDETRLVSPGRGVAYRAQWSHDSRYFSFKKIDRQGQTPCIYNISEDKIIELFSTVPLCGIPSLSQNEKVSFSIDKTLYITDMQGTILQTIILDHYANQTPLSPDGKYVVFNDKNDVLFLLELETGERRQIFSNTKGLFEPIWNNDGSAIAASSISGEIYIYDMNTKNDIAVGKGHHSVWDKEGAVLYFSRYKIIPEQAVLDADIYRINRDGTRLQVIDDDQIWADFPVISQSGALLFCDRKEGRLLKAEISAANKNESLKLENVSGLRVPSFDIQTSSHQISLPEIAAQEDNCFDIPYVNQRYDTPDWFNGNWACGATAAIMCIGYYDLMEDWPVWVSSPYRHLSPLGNYICSIYSFNSYTFNIWWATDPNGTKGYGGYGHIVRNNPAWADTKGNMADYAKKHGLSSFVDWAPSRQKVMDEVAAKNPFVLLNSLTGSGHYISVIGYKNEATTVIVNDPYGNKNNGYCNFYGRRSYYDWLGYSNGNENLNTIWCFIYFQGEPPTHPDFVSSSIQVQDSIHLGAEFQFKAKISNQGDGASVDAFASLILSSDLVYDYYDRELELIPMGEIEVSDSMLIDQSFVIHDSLVGNYYCLGIYADYDSTNREMVRENNDALMRVKITGYTNINILRPVDESVITDKRPSIYARYREKFGEIDTADVQLYFDGENISDKCTITYKKITFEPNEDLSVGTHHLRVEVINSYNLQSNQEWSFTIEEETGITDGATTAPGTFSLEQNYPNPFNSETVIRYQLPVETIHESSLHESSVNVELTIYNILGKKVRTLVKTDQPAGRYELRWNGRDDFGHELSSGLYLLKLSANGKSRIRRMLYLK